MIKEEILKKVGAESFFYQTMWNGYKVYGLEFGEDATIGLPMFILEKGSKVRLTTEEEAFAIIDTFEDEKEE